MTPPRPVKPSPVRPGAESETTILKERLAEHAQAWRMLIDHSAYPTLVYDKTGLIQHVNARAAKWLGQTEDALCQTPLSQCLEGKAPLPPWQAPEVAYDSPIQCVFKNANSEPQKAAIHQQTIIWMDRPMTLLSVHPQDNTTSEESSPYSNFFQQLNLAVEAALELMNVSDIDTLYVHAVTIARERLGFERVGIKKVENGKLECMFGTDMKGQTTDERGCKDPLSTEQYTAHSEYESHKPRFLIVEEGEHRYFGEDGQAVFSGKGWIASTPVWGPNNRLLALISNDTAISHAGQDGIGQMIMVLYASLLGAIIHSKLEEFKHREIQQRFSEMAEAMKEVFWITNPDGSKIHFVSPAFEGLWGIRREELYANPYLWLNAMHPDDRQRVNQEFSEKAALGSFSEEYRIISSDGQEHWIWDRGSPILNDEGEVIRVVGIAEDITAFKQTELSLRKAESRYRSLVEHLPSATYIMEAGSNRLSYISPQIEAVLGLSVEKAMAMPFPWLETIHPEDRHKVDVLMRNAITKENYISLLYRSVPVDGNYRWILHDAMIHHEASREEAFIQGNLQDVTLQQEDEARERQLSERSSRAQRLESLAVLAGGVAHDLNNLLGPVVGYPDLILDTLDENHPARADIQEIKKSAERAAEVIQDLLALARQTGMEVEPVHAQDVIEQYATSASCKELATKYPKVRLELDIPEKPLYVIGSIHRLTQIMMNLILNAYEAILTQKGRVQVIMESIRLDKPHQGFEQIPEGEYVVTRICDDGSGLRLEDRGRIFEPFYSRKKLGRSGSGLGLAVVYGIVKDLEGYLDVESELGKGTRFSIFLPRITAAPLSSDQECIDPSGNESILVLDDLGQQQTLMKRLLAEYGYTVVTAGSLEEALIALSQKPVKLALIDMILDGDLDGLDAFRQVRQKAPDVKCVLVTGFAETDRVKSALLEGANGIIHKPFTKETLTESVRKYLDQPG